MAILSVTELWGVEGEADDENTREYTRVFQVITDNAEVSVPILSTAVDPQTGLQIPPKFDGYPTDQKSLAIKIKVKQNKDAPDIAIVTVSYSSKTPDQQQVKDDPTGKPPKCKWGKAQFVTPAIHDVSGMPIVNSASDPFNPPPEKDDSRAEVEVTYNLRQVPSWILDFSDKLNDADLTIEGIVVKAGEAKVQEVAVGHWQVENDVYYREVTLRIQIRKNKKLWIAESQLDTDEPIDDAPPAGQITPPSAASPTAALHEAGGWALVLLDRGFNELVQDGPTPTDPPTLKQKAIMVNGVKPSEPKLLDGNGKVLTNLGFQPGQNQGVYLIYDVYERVSFGPLNLPA